MHPLDLAFVVVRSSDSWNTDSLDNQQSPHNIMSGSDYEGYSFKKIRELCERQKKAVKERKTTDFKINEIWIENFQPMFGLGYFLRLLNRIRDDTGYIELRDNVIKLGEGKNSMNRSRCLSGLNRAN